MIAAEILEAHDNLAGLFIWDFADQAIRIRDQGKEKLLYGGDFREGETSGYFCANGIIACDRSPHPALAQVRASYQDIKFSLEDAVHGRIVVRNQHYFTNLSRYELVWRIDCDGAAVLSRTCGSVELAPQEEIVLELPYLYESLPDGECILTVLARLKEDALWAEKGYEAAG